MFYCKIKQLDDKDKESKEEGKQNNNELTQLVNTHAAGLNAEARFYSFVNDNLSQHSYLRTLLCSEFLIKDSNQAEVFSSLKNQLIKVLEVGEARRLQAKNDPKVEITEQEEKNILCYAKFKKNLAQYNQSLLDMNFSVFLNGGYSDFIGKRCKDLMDEDFNLTVQSELLSVTNGNFENYIDALLLKFEKNSLESNLLVHFRRSAFLKGKFGETDFIAAMMFEKLIFLLEANSREFKHVLQYQNNKQALYGKFADFTQCWSALTDNANNVAYWKSFSEALANTLISQHTQDCRSNPEHHPIDFVVEAIFTKLCGNIKDNNLTRTNIREYVSAYGKERPVSLLIGEVRFALLLAKLAEYPQLIRALQTNFIREKLIEYFQRKVFPADLNPFIRAVTRATSVKSLRKAIDEHLMGNTYLGLKNALKEHFQTLSLVNLGRFFITIEAFHSVISTAIGIDYGVVCLELFTNILHDLSMAETPGLVDKLRERFKDKMTETDTWIFIDTVKSAIDKKLLSDIVTKYLIGEGNKELSVTLKAHLNNLSLSSWGAFIVAIEQVKDVISLSRVIEQHLISDAALALKQKLIGYFRALSTHNLNAFTSSVTQSINIKALTQAIDKYLLKDKTRGLLAPTKGGYERVLLSENDANAAIGEARFLQVINQTKSVAPALPVVVPTDSVVNDQANRGFEIRSELRATLETYKDLLIKAWVVCGVPKQKFDFRKADQEITLASRPMHMGKLLQDRLNHLSREGRDSNFVRALLNPKRLTDVLMLQYKGVCEDPILNNTYVRTALHYADSYADFIKKLRENTKHFSNEEINSIFVTLEKSEYFSKLPIQKDESYASLFYSAVVFEKLLLRLQENSKDFQYFLSNNCLVAIRNLFPQFHSWRINRENYESEEQKIKHWNDDFVMLAIEAIVYSYRISDSESILAALVSKLFHDQLKDAPSASQFIETYYDIYQQGKVWSLMVSETRFAALIERLKLYPTLQRLLSTHFKVELRKFFQDNPLPKSLDLFLAAAKQITDGNSLCHVVETYLLAVKKPLNLQINLDSSSAEGIRKEIHFNFNRLENGSTDSSDETEQVLSWVNECLAQLNQKNSPPLSLRDKASFQAILAYFVEDAEFCKFLIELTRLTQDNLIKPLSPLESLKQYLKTLNFQDFNVVLSRISREQIAKLLNHELLDHTDYELFSEDKLVEIQQTLQAEARYQVILAYFAEDAEFHTLFSLPWVKTHLQNYLQMYDFDDLHQLKLTLAQSLATADSPQAMVNAVKRILCFDLGTVVPELGEELALNLLVAAGFINFMALKDFSDRPQLKAFFVLPGVKQQVISAWRVSRFDIASRVPASLTTDERFASQIKDGIKSCMAEILLKDHDALNVVELNDHLATAILAEARHLVIKAALDQLKLSEQDTQIIKDYLQDTPLSAQDIQRIRTYLKNLEDKVEGDNPNPIVVLLGKARFADVEQKWPQIRSVINNESLKSVLLNYWQKNSANIDFSSLANKLQSANINNVRELLLITLFGDRRLDITLQQQIVNFTVEQVQLEYLKGCGKIYLYAQSLLDMEEPQKALISLVEEDSKNAIIVHWQRNDIPSKDNLRQLLVSLSAIELHSDDTLPVTIALGTCFGFQFPAVTKDLATQLIAEARYTIFMQSIEVRGHDVLVSFAQDFYAESHLPFLKEVLTDSHGLVTENYLIDLLRSELIQSTLTEYFKTNKCPTNLANFLDLIRNNQTLNSIPQLVLAIERAVHLQNIYVYYGVKRAVVTPELREVEKTLLTRIYEEGQVSIEKLDAINRVHDQIPEVEDLFDRYGSHLVAAETAKNNLLIGKNALQAVIDVQVNINIFDLLPENFNILDCIEKIRNKLVSRDRLPEVLEDFVQKSNSLAKPCSKDQVRTITSSELKSIFLCVTKMQTLRFNDLELAQWIDELVRMLNVFDMIIRWFAAKVSNPKDVPIAVNTLQVRLKDMGYAKAIYAYTDNEQVKDAVRPVYLDYLGSLLMGIVGHQNYTIPLSDFYGDAVQLLDEALENEGSISQFVVPVVQELEELFAKKIKSESTEGYSERINIGIGLLNKILDSRSWKNETLLSSEALRDKVLAVADAAARDCIKGKRFELYINLVKVVVQKQSVNRVCDFKNGLLTTLVKLLTEELRIKDICSLLSLCIMLDENSKESIKLEFMKLYGTLKRDGNTNSPYHHPALRCSIHELFPDYASFIIDGVHKASNKPLKLFLCDPQGQINLAAYSHSRELHEEMLRSMSIKEHGMFLHRLNSMLRDKKSLDERLALYRQFARAVESPVCAWVMRRSDMNDFSLLKLYMSLHDISKDKKEIDDKTREMRAVFVITHSAENSELYNKAKDLWSRSVPSNGWTVVVDKVNLDIESFKRLSNAILVGGDSSSDSSPSSTRPGSRDSSRRNSMSLSASSSTSNVSAQAARLVQKQSSVANFGEEAPPSPQQPPSTPGSFKSRPIGTSSSSESLRPQRAESDSPPPYASPSAPIAITSPGTPPPVPSRRPPPPPAPVPPSPSANGSGVKNIEAVRDNECLWNSFALIVAKNAKDFLDNPKANAALEPILRKVCATYAREKGAFDFTSSEFAAEGKLDFTSPQFRGLGFCKAFKAMYESGDYTNIQAKLRKTFKVMTYNYISSEEGKSLRSGHLNQINEKMSAIFEKFCAKPESGQRKPDLGDLLEDSQQYADLRPISNKITDIVNRLLRLDPEAKSKPQVLLGAFMSQWRILEKDYFQALKDKIIWAGDLEYQALSQYLGIRILVKVNEAVDGKNNVGGSDNRDNKQLAVIWGIHYTDPKGPQGLAAHYDPWLQGCSIQVPEPVLDPPPVSPPRP